MSHRRPPFLVVGHLNKPHGLRGELFVWPLTDHPERHFAPGEIHRLGKRDAESPDCGLPPLAIETVRPYRRGFLTRFRGVRDRDAAAAIQGRYLLRPFETAAEPDEDEIFYHELLGASVSTRAGVDLGEVTEVFPLKPSDLLQVDGGAHGEVMIPFNREIVVEVDRRRRRLVVDPPPGLLE